MTLRRSVRRSSHAVRFTCAALATAVFAACTSAPPPAPPAPPPAPPPPPPPAAPAAPPPQGGPVRLIYRDNWLGAVQLLGVDTAQRRAFLRMESAAPKRLLIDTIDYETGKRVDRWEATQSNADATVKKYPLFRPMSGSFEEDLVRFAKLVQATGPWYMRGRQLGPPVAVSPDGEYILYGARPDSGGDGDWLYVVDRNGQRPRRVDTGVRASYAPVFSPDGSRIAWQGCVASPCGYALYVTKLGGAPERVTQVPESSAPVWGSDGRYLYVVGRPKPRRACLYKVRADAVHDVKSLKCADDLRDVEFVQDPSGRTGVLTGFRGVPGQQIFEYTWLLLNDGSVLATHAIDRAAGSGLLSEAGLLLIPMQKGGIGVIDLVSGNAGAVVDAEGWFFGLETTKWIGDTVILLRRTGAPDFFELVAVDVRSVTSPKAG